MKPLFSDEKIKQLMDEYSQFSSSVSGIELLEEHGLELVYQQTGYILITLPDYSGRPITDRNTYNYLSQPVGYINTTPVPANSPTYLLKVPSYISPPPKKGNFKLSAEKEYFSFSDEQEDIAPALKSLVTYALNFQRRYAPKTSVNELIHHFLAYPEMLDKIPRIAEAGLPAKKVDDYMKLGYSLEQIIQLKDLPAEWMFEFAAHVPPNLNYR